MLQDFLCWLVYITNLICITLDVLIVLLKSVLHVKPEITPVNEHGALMYAGRWGIHGVSLPGRVTFSPGNVGWVTFGAPRPRQVCTWFLFVLGTWTRLNLFCVTDWY